MQPAICQYYYNDVVSLKTAASIYINLKKNNIHQVTAQSTESDATPTAGFAYNRLILNNAAQIVTTTSFEATGTTTTSETYANNLLVQSLDTAANAFTSVNYTYDGNTNLLTLETATDDTSMNMHSTELHKWFYTGNVPDSMLRIKDNSDTTVVHFKKDAKQNIIDETWLKKNRIVEHYFYYYDDDNRLTDVVRFNTHAQQLLPDFLFAYSSSGFLSQLTEIPEGSSDYITWQYIYDERGLKIKDVLFDKHQQLLGTVTYQYN